MDTPPSPTPYKPLIFQPTSQEDRKSVSREVAKDWLNFLSGKKLSISQWRKMGPISLDGQNKHGVNHSISITFNRAVEHILDNQGFFLDSFDIRNERFIPWADPSGSLSLQLYWEKPGTNGKPHRIFMDSNNIKNFPFYPGLDREGIAINPLHPHLARMIIAARQRLVHNSELMFNNDTAWLHDLLSYFNFSVSIIEGWLTLVYYKAKYDPTSAGLLFNLEKMGSVYNRRLSDKLAWISHVSGRPLEKVEKEVLIFTQLKEIRNHLNHFDPPFFAATIEDVATWLNMFFHIARLLWKTRRHLGLPPDPGIIQLLFQDTVDFVPQNPTGKRVPQTLGYASCQWPVPQQ